MKKYAVCIDKILFLIFPCFERELVYSDICDEIPAGSYAVIITPSVIADFAVLCYTSDGAIMKEPDLPFAALSFFLRRVRGLPLGEIDVEFMGKVYTRDVSVNYAPVFYKNLGKCQRCLSKNIVLEDKTEVSCYDVRRHSYMRIFVVASANAMNVGYLRSLIVRDGEDIVDAVITASYDGEVWISSSSHNFHYEYIASAVSVLTSQGIIAKDGEYIARFCGGVHKLKITSDKIIFLPEPELLN